MNLENLIYLLSLLTKYSTLFKIISEMGKWCPSGYMPQMMLIVRAKQQNKTMIDILSWNAVDSIIHINTASTPLSNRTVITNTVSMQLSNHTIILPLSINITVVVVDG